MRTLLVVLALCLSACSHANATRIGGPENAARYDITCGSSFDACVDEARSLCPNGYTKRESGGYVRPAVAPRLASAEFRGYLEIQCTGATAQQLELDRGRHVADL